MKVLAVLLLAASAAHAECPVRVADAPEDVRVAIEGWAHREQVCGPPLEVRVVATPQGLHLWARDPLGRTRERTVPDADSVAVLVASWMADDSISSPPPLTEAPPSHVEVDPETGALRDDRDRPESAPVPRVEAAPTKVARTPALTFGALGGYDGFGAIEGVRLEYEVANLGRWALSVSGSISEGNLMTWGPGFYVPTSHVTDYRALVSFGPTFWFGGWSFRPAFAAGIASRRAEGSATTRAYEVSLALARHVSGAWSMVLEPTYFVSPVHDQYMDANGQYSFQELPNARPQEIDVMLGLRRAL